MILFAFKPWHAWIIVALIVLLLVLIILLKTLFFKDKTNYHQAKPLDEEKDDIVYKLGELLKIVDDSESADADKSISEDTLKESVDWTSNPIWTRVINILDDAIYDIEKEEAIALLEQIKKDCDVFINSLK